jgi:RND family efflux transporter MFP subunit
LKPELRRSLGVVALAVAITLAATSLIEANKVTTTSLTRAPMPVAATIYAVQAGFQREANYLGLIKAGSDSDIGFEVAGVLTALPATEGKRVAPGEVLAQLGTDRRQARLDAASAGYERVVAERSLADTREARLARLLDDGSVSQQEYDDTRFAAQALAAAETSAAAERQSAELELIKSTLVAPYEAVVAERLVQIGTVVAPGTPVLRLVTTTGREAHIGVPVEVARRLAPGAHYSLALSDTRIEGRLRSIRDDVDPATLTVGTVFDLPADTPVSVGESVRLHVNEQIPMAGGWLPITALLEAPRGLWDVLTITPDEHGQYRAHRESVEVLHTRGKEVFVRGTLATGVAVVASGLQRISPGDLVEPVYKQSSTTEEAHGS